MIGDLHATNRSAACWEQDRQCSGKSKEHHMQCFQSQTCEADKAELQHESIYRDTSQATTGKDPAT